MCIRLILGALLGAALLSGMALVGPLAREARGDFTLWDSQQMTVDTSHWAGTLYDQSRARIVPGGSVTSWLSAYNSSAVDISGGSLGGLRTYDTSAADISGGSVDYTLETHNASTVHISGTGYVNTFYAYDTGAVDISGGGYVNWLRADNTSAVNISGGRVEDLYAVSTSTVAISGGTVVDLYAYNTSAVNISGGGYVNALYTYDLITVDFARGKVAHLYAGGTSTVTFHGQDFLLGPGLSLDGDRVLGTGVLSGECFDGGHWTVNIDLNASGATILAIPEPATLSLLALGSAMLVRRRRVAPQTDRP